MSVAFYILITHISVQDVFVKLLDTDFAHVKGAAVVCLIEHLHFLFADAPNIPKGVGKQLAKGVMTQ